MSSAILDFNPLETWEGLATELDSIIVDVRTQAEWLFVGTPDLSKIEKKVIFLEWKNYPEMHTNTVFASDLLKELDGASPSKIYFLCRSGARSLAAAQLMSKIFEERNQVIECINIAEGFEGDLNSSGHRGSINGWKMRGLAWRQS